MKTKCEVYSRKDPITGRFITIHGKTQYKAKQYKGKRIDEHRLVWTKSNGEIPKGYVIHHINGNKKDNRLENLEMMTYDEHNKLHTTGRSPWNKGIKAPSISKSKMNHIVTQEQITKQRMTLFNKYLDSFIEIWKMKDNNKSVDYISKELNLTKDQVTNRWLSFKRQYIDIVEGVI